MSVVPASSRSSAFLIPVAGPGNAPIALAHKPGGLLVGRHESCDVRLAGDNVSRTHARLSFDGRRWRAADLKSRWGTFVNGMRLAPDRETPLGEGDLLRITPWTFRFAGSMSSKSGLLDSAMQPVDDSPEAARLVTTLGSGRLPTLGDEMLALLLESAAGIHAAGDEKSLAELVLDKACQGSGLPNAALLKPASTGGRFEVVASRRASGTGPIAYSRSLLSAAADGELAELSTARQPIDVSQSIVSMGVRSALCVPIMLGQTTAAYLYLDSRGEENASHLLPLRPNAAPFCLGLARMAGLALANLKRVEMERRSAAMDAELAAAAAAQQWILPRRVGSARRFSWTGESRPGAHLAGDFYDLIPLPDGRLAAAIGDVSGHGVAASVLMTAAAGFLHAALQESGDPGAALTRLNAFICPRRPTDKFVTMWVGVFDPDRGTLRYVDAGHGYVLVGPDEGGLDRLDRGGQFPVGIEEDCRYESIEIPLAAAGRALLISDGIVEQFSGESDAGSRAKPFGLDGLEQVIGQSAGGDLVAQLFDAVTQHAGRQSLSDDATAVLVRW